MDLLIIVGLSFLLAPVAVFTSEAARIALGLAFVLFFPGYTALTALFPKKGDLEGTARVALSFGLSFVIVPFIGLALNFSPWGVRLYPLVISLPLFTTGAAAIAWRRRRKLLPEERFDPGLSNFFPALLRALAPQGRWDRILRIALGLAISVAAGTLAYSVFATPEVGEKFTQFYVLDSQGKTANYPRQIAVGEKAGVVLAIENHEWAPIQYRVEIRIGGEKVAEITPISLAHKEKWREEVTFTPTKDGPEQRVEFWLYRGASLEPYRTLHILIDAKGIR